MAGISDLFGSNGLLEQLVLWGLLNQVLSTATGPALTSLQQDVDSGHPVNVLDPGTLAEAAVRGMSTIASAEADAAKSGIDAARFATLVDMATVRIPPADLATAVLRSYVTQAAAQTQATAQGWSAADFATLIDLAGDGIAPGDAVRAQQRGLIPDTGTGADSVSFDQAIAESRLHDKWGPVLTKLAAALLTPGDAADAVVRNFMSAADGADVAGKQGFTSADFETLVHLAGDAPAPGQLAEALRRKLIAESGTGADSTSFAQGIAEGRLAGKWTEVIKGLAMLWPTPVDALDAQVKGQITQDQANALYVQLGGDPQFQTWLYDSMGEGPSPLEAATLAARGIIDWTGSGADSTSYEQAVKESHYRDKWTSAYEALAQHIPAPSTVIQLYAHAIISKEQATAQLLQNDMTSDQAAAYIAEAEYQSVSEYRGLAQSEVVTMYYGRLLSSDQAMAILESLHVSQDAANLMLEYADMRYQVSAMNKTVSRLGTLFASRKIGLDTARASLQKLGLTVSAVTAVLDDWQLEASINVKTLTAAQIADALLYGAIDQAEAMTLMNTIGYTDYDAWVLLSVAAKAALPDKPVSDAVPAQPPVSPGTT
jgi:hypothetical protein